MMRCGAVPCGALQFSVFKKTERCRTIMETPHKYLSSSNSIFGMLRTKFFTALFTLATKNVWCWRQWSLDSRSFNQWRHSTFINSSRSFWKSRACWLHKRRNYDELPVCTNQIISLVSSNPRKLCWITLRERDESSMDNLVQLVWFSDV